MAAKNIFKIFVSLIFSITSTLIMAFILYFAFNLYGHEQSNALVAAPLAAVSNAKSLPAALRLPASLIIPNINVDAKIIDVGLDSKGAVDVPKGPFDVAWFDLGPLPGEKGSAIISGHYGPWQTGASSVFDNLHKLKKGDKIYVKNNSGSVISFTVTGLKTYSQNQSPVEVFNKNDGAYLNLITCAGDWIQSQKTYSQRLVVFAKAVQN
jgi:LPXTG-site transpeptidase (sortase) family protein